MTQLSRLLSSAALALVLTGGVVAAADQPANAFRLDPTQSSTGSYLAGREALEDLRTEDAARYFRDASVAGWDNPNIVERTFTAYAANGQISDAASAAKHLLELGQKNELASLIIGTEALKQGKYDEADQALAGIDGNSFQGIAAGVVRAWALVAENKYDDAQKILDGIGNGGIEDFLVYHRALMAEVAGKTDDALGFAQKAYEADPNGARTVETYIRLLGNAGRFDEAQKTLSAYGAEGIDRPLIDALSAPIAAKQAPGMFATTVQEGAAELYRSIGAALAREGSNEIAAEFLRMGMYLAPKADLIAMLYGQLLDGAERHEAANAIYSQLPDGSPFKLTASVRFAQNYDALGKPDEALKQLGTIVAANPTDVDALSVLGDLQRSSKDYGDAVSTYTKLIQASGPDDQTHWRYYFVRGISYERNQQWPLAETDFKHALELSPDEPQVLNYLGYSWVDKGENLMTALDMIKKAVQGSPNDGYIVDSLGWAYYRLGRYADAVTELEQAVQMRSTDPEINDHLGDAYWHIGRKLEARFQWNVAASVDTEGDVKARVEKKLAQGLDAVEQAAPTTQAEATPKN